MMYELKNVYQKEKNRYRRWFEDDYFDLIVWHDSGNNITGFQLCYDRFRNEHAFTWYKGKGFYHDKVDDGRNPMHIMSTPILISDGPFPSLRILKRFKESSKNIDSKIAQLVIEKIIEFSNLK